MKEYSVSDLKDQFQKLGYIWPSGFHLIGVRSAADAPDSFDDRFHILWPVNGGLAIKSVPCTTNPGVYWLKNWFTPKGCAVLKPGQYLNCWKIGKHRNEYEALVQCAPVTIYYDTNKDSKSDEGGLQETDLFGINIHRAAQSWTSKVVDKWSAGCQVLADPNDFNELMRLCKSANQSRFTYTLLKEF